MANRLTKIYTRTGDSGLTGMADGTRIKKDDARVQAIGEVDELNSQLGVLACHLSGSLHESVRMIQNELFNIGAELSLGQSAESITGASQENIDWLESHLDYLNQSLSPLKEFILPGGGIAASHCHVARAVCRRAERSLVTLNEDGHLNAMLMAYINRLSDYLFVLARAISREQGEDEVYWQSEKLSISEND